MFILGILDILLYSEGCFRRPGILTRRGFAGLPCEE